MSVAIRRSVGDPTKVHLEPDHPLHDIVERAQKAEFNPTLDVVERTHRHNLERAARSR